MGAYQSELGRIIVAFKEQQRYDLAAILANLLSFPIRQICQQQPHPVLVPIPSSRIKIRQRGYHPMQVIVTKTVRILHRQGYQASWLPLLQQRAARKDQAGLTKSERADNLTGKISLNHFLVSKLSNFAASQLIICDDVITTGATVWAAQQALNQQDLLPIGIASIARTMKSLP